MCGQHSRFIPWIALLHECAVGLLTHLGADCRLEVVCGHVCSVETLNDGQDCRHHQQKG